MATPDPASVEWVPIWSAVTEGPVGPAGPPGAPGAQGPPGLSTSVFFFKADANSTAENDPGTGKMRWNAKPQTDATFLYFDRLTDDGFDIIALLQQTTFGTHFIIQDADLSANSQTWKQLAPGVVMGGDWFEVEVEFVSQSGTGTMQNNQRVAVLLDTMVGPHAYTHDTGGEDPITALDATVLTTGFLDDARLSSNVPRLDQANVFTQPTTFDAITATVVTAEDLSTTPLDASNLTTGTVPDARLSGNVQMKPVALTDLPASVATLPVAQSDVTGLVSDLAAITSVLATKAPLDSPTLTGVPTAPTADVGTATAQLATTAFVFSYLTATGYVTGPTSAEVNNLAAFNSPTGARIADSTIPLAAVARKDQSNIFTAAVTFQVGPTAPTAAPGTNTTQVATTAFVVSTIATSTATPAAHHASHETGGSDALAALSASILTTGTVANARLTVDVLRVTGGYPGGTTTFLRADGTFAVASGAVAAHHATHEPGGADALVGAAWLALANTFTANQLVKATQPEWQLQGTGATAKTHLVVTDGSQTNLTYNLTYAGGSVWNRDDVSLPGSVLFMNIGQFGIYTAPAGANPAALTARLAIDATGLMTASALKLNGAYPQLVLESSIALMQLNATTAAVDAKKWRLWCGASGYFQIDCLNDAESGVTVAPVVISRAGQVRLSDQNPALQIGGATSVFPALRKGAANTNPNNPAMLDVTTADVPASAFAGVRASNFISTSNYNNLGDLTVTGGTAFQGGVNITGGNLTGAGASVMNGPTYPGRVDTTGSQTSWYLGSHGAYGLYTNTNIYVAGVQWVAGWQSIGGDLTVAGLATLGRRFVFHNCTASYNAVNGDFILAQGTITIYLPPPADGAVIDVKVYAGNPGTVTVLTNNYAYYIDYPNTAYVMTVPNQCATFVGGVSQWFIR